MKLHMKTYYNSKRAVSYNRTWRAFSEKTLAAKSWAGNPPDFVLKPPVNGSF